MFTAIELKDQGNVLFNEGKFQEALQKYNEATQADPKLAAAWFNKGTAHKKLNQLPEAVEALNQALALQNNYTKAKYHKADTLLLMQEYKQAWDLFNNILIENPDHIEARLGKFKCEQHFAAKIIFANVDLKLTQDGKIKILEFGRGMQSGFMGLTVATRENIVELLHQRFEQLNLPPLILNTDPGLEFPNVADVEHIFTADTNSTTTNFTPEKIGNHSVVYGGIDLKPKNEKEVLVLDDPGVNFTFEDKCLTHEAFVSSNSEATRPRTVKLERKFTPQLAKQIRQGLPNTSQYVLKVPDMEGGKGVVVVDNTDLEVTLSCLLAVSEKDQKETSTSYAVHFARKYNDLIKAETKCTSDFKAFGTWNNSYSSTFLVEEYITSKTISHDNKSFDPTMRVAFLIIRDDNKVTCEPFACYWKLPPHPINHRGELRDKTVSSFSETRQDAVRVSEADQESVYTQLKATLPAVISSMLKRNLAADIEALPNITVEQKDYKAHLWMHFANALTSQGQYELAKHYLEKVEKILPNNFRVFHEFGVFYHQQGKHSEALSSFDKAITKRPGNSATYYRRGITKDALNRTDEAEQDFAKAIQLNSSYKIAIDKYKQIKQQRQQDAESTQHTATTSLSNN